MKGYLRLINRITASYDYLRGEASVADCLLLSLVFSGHVACAIEGSGAANIMSQRAAMKARSPVVAQTLVEKVDH